jgi:hypothetical protein
MALQMTTYLSGRVGNLVFVNRGDQHYSRSIPAKIRQTAATKNSSSLFAEASAAAKVLRTLLQPIMPVKQDKQMQNGFFGAVARSIKLIKAGNMLQVHPLPALSPFDCNPATGIRERFRVALSVSRISDSLVGVHIPAFIPALQIAAPAHTTRVDIYICAASYSVTHRQGQGSDHYLLQLPYNNTQVAAQTILLALPATPGSLVLTGMRMCYFMGDQQPVMKPAFMPSSVIDAAYY